MKVAVECIESDEVLQLDVLVLAKSKQNIVDLELLLKRLAVISSEFIHQRNDQIFT